MSRTKYIPTDAFNLAMIDALRECFGLQPLYAPERETQYVVIRSMSVSVCLYGGRRLGTRRRDGEHKEGE